MIRIVFQMRLPMRVNSVNVAERHASEAGGDGDQRAEEGHASAQQHGRTRPAIEPGLGPIEVGLAEADPVAVPDDDGPQTNGTHRRRESVQDPCAHDRPDRGGDDHADHRRITP